MLRKIPTYVSHLVGYVYNRLRCEGEKRLAEYIFHRKAVFKPYNVHITSKLFNVDTDFVLL